MFVVHFRLRKGVLAAGLATAVMLVALAFVLPGCNARQEDAPIPAATEEQRLAYLTSLGWTVDSTPVETLDLQLPRQLDGDWAAYARLQEEQGLPFLPCAGKQVRRYTYRVSNYPALSSSLETLPLSQNTKLSLSINSFVSLNKVKLIYPSGFFGI